MVDHDFARRLKATVEKFNQETGMKATYRHGPLKSLERLRQKERDLGLVCSAETFERRTQSSQIFDYVRIFGGQQAFPLAPSFSLVHLSTFGASHGIQYSF